MRHILRLLWPRARVLTQRNVKRNFHASRVLFCARSTSHVLKKPSDIMDHEIEEMLAPLRVAVKEQVNWVKMMQPYFHMFHMFPSLALVSWSFSLHTKFRLSRMMKPHKLF